MRNKRISLYSAFLLNQDELSLRRVGYRQPAWRHSLSLSGVLALYMQYLFSLAIGEHNVSRTVQVWLEKDVSLLKSKRAHYIKKYLAHLSSGEPPKDQLLEMSGIRSRYEHLSDDDGPYHTEVFPYDYYSPEDVLLGKSDACVERSGIEPEVEQLMLAVSSWS